MQHEADYFLIKIIEIYTIELNDSDQNGFKSRIENFNFSTPSKVTICLDFPPELKMTFFGGKKWVVYNVYRRNIVRMALKAE